ncbi:hypothetical protein BDZ91DRAFT_823789 [Kalaharituber pfeilii]|nr:hypothetical protein BDZ91DRAFT_823789 [Kalaharituber pfeilii]
MGLWRTAQPPNASAVSDRGGDVTNGGMSVMFGGRGRRRGRGGGGGGGGLRDWGGRIRRLWAEGGSNGSRPQDDGTNEGQPVCRTTLCGKKRKRKKEKVRKKKRRKRKRKRLGKLMEGSTIFRCPPVPAGETLGRRTLPSLTGCPQVAALDAVSYAGQMARGDELGQQQAAAGGSRRQQATAAAAAAAAAGQGGRQAESLRGFRMMLPVTALWDRAPD